MSVCMHACVRACARLCGIGIGMQGLTTTELCPGSLFAFSFEKDSYSVAQAALGLAS